MSSSATPQLDVAVNLTWLTTGRVGGSEEYLVRQLTAIADGAGGQDADLRLHLYTHPSFVAEHPQLADLIVTSTMPTQRDSRAIRIAAEHSWLAAKTRGADIVHHAGGTMPLVGNRSTLLTVHDLQYRSFPEYFSRGRRAYLDAMLPRSVRAASLVAVPSQYVKSTVVDAFGVDPDDVVVVAHGFPAHTMPTSADVERVRKTYGVDGPYVAYAAITHPHKGHRRLVDALATTSTRSHPLAGYRLVLLGGEGTAEDEVRAAIDASGVGDRVIRTGRVSPADRDALIAGAEVLAFPSEYEGFGAPLVEAMTLDVPVVASDHPAIVEVVGDAGLIVSSPEPDAWTTAIAAAIEDRDRLVARGRCRRADYTLERSGRELGAAYRDAARRAG